MRYTFFSSSTRIIIFVAAVCLTILYNFIYTRSFYIKETTYQYKIDSLSYVINNYEVEQDKLTNNILELQQKVINLDHEIDSTTQVLYKTRKYYEKKIRDINDYTPSELDKFFSDRYE
jgi:peptidoglycan hydrolase CwlO-like protein